ncbi:MinD/ParA family protein [Microbacterium sp. NPDC091313]
MTPDRRDDHPDDLDENGVLDDTMSVDTAGIGILGARTGHVRLTLPADTEDLVDEDEAVDDVAPEAIAALDAPEPEAADEPGAGDEPETGSVASEEEVATGELILDDEPVADAPRDEDVHDADVVEDEPAAATNEPGDDADDSTAPDESEGESSRIDDAVPSADVPDAAAAADDETQAAATAAVSVSAAESVALAESVSVAEDAAAPDAAESVVAASAAEPAADAPEPDAAAPAEPEPEAATPVEPAPQMESAAAPATATVPVGRPVPLTGSVPTTRREAHHADELARGDRAHAVERVRPPQQDLDLNSKRLGEFEPDRESADLLTADRLLDRGQLSGAEPEGLWQQFVYTLSRHRINLGDSRKVRERKELDRRIAGALPGGARFVPVVSRKGGVGKTTVTTLLGMALASARDDRVIAIDANPDRGTLADRIGRTGGRTVRDLARARGEVTGFNDISTIVARDETRLDVLASDADPRVSEAFSDRDYHDVAALAAHYYSIVLTDTGTGIVHSVMGATLDLADQLVVVAGLSVDEARLASETLTWLETNGYADQVRRAVVVLNNARPGAPLVRESELETHFRTRVRSVVRVPYDPLIGSGSAISFRDLQPATRAAARQLAAAVVEGLRSGVVAA